MQTQVHGWLTTKSTITRRFILEWSDAALSCSSFLVDKLRAWRQQTLVPDLPQDFFLSVLFQDPFEWEWRFSGLIGEFFYIYLYIILFYFIIIIIIFEGWRMFFGTFRGSLQRFPKDPAGFSWINKSLMGCCWQTSATARANDVTARFFIQQFKFNAARSDESRRRSPS